MKRFAFLIGFVLLSFPFVFGQHPLSGEWKGRLTQEDGGLTHDYVFRMVIEVSGSKVKGRSYIHAANQPEVNGIMKLTGNISHGHFYFTESRIEEEAIIDLWQWCQKAARLQLDTNGTTWTMEGLWQGTVEFNDCAPGTISISKAPPQRSKQEEELAALSKDILKGREVEDQGTVNIRQKQLTVYLWDSDEIDGDIISLNFNGEWVLQKQRLGRKKLKLTLDILPGEENTLVMYAENVGRIPPNTATLAFFDGQRQHKISLASDLSKSGSLNFVIAK